MLNIFYNPIYFKRRGVLLTKSFKFSIFYNALIDINYFLNVPINENLITSGPQKRMNNLIKTFRNQKNISFNSNKFSNTYIVQFDEFGQTILEKIIKDKKLDTKVLIGPLYSIEQDRKLNEMINKYPYIKKVVASSSAYENCFRFDKNFRPDTTIVLPSGVVSENTIQNNLKIKDRKNKVLIYYKKRSQEDLNSLTDFLNKKGQPYKIFRYGEYKHKDLIKAAKECKFGITVSCTESQGFGIQEIMACNLPLLVWDYKVNQYEEFTLPGTTVPYWSNLCGKIVSDKIELFKYYDEFENNLSNYNPANFINENLTYENFYKNLLNSYNF